MSIFPAGPQTGGEFPVTQPSVPVHLLAATSSPYQPLFSDEKPGVHPETGVANGQGYPG